ncbi:hypothetical protein CsSME_00018442 [Camellia sinensis var. sinensis]
MNFLHIEFLWLNGIADLAKKMMETGKDKVYPLIYLLLTLALICLLQLLLLRGLVVCIERDIFDGVDNDTIMENFQKMKTRQGQL